MKSLIKSPTYIRMRTNPGATIENIIIESKDFSVKFKKKTLTTIQMINSDSLCFKIFNFV